LGEDTCIKYKQKRVVPRKLKITLTNKRKRKNTLAGIWAKDTTRKFTEEEKKNHDQLI